MKSFARSLVSKKKRRYRDHGFDLDLSYITPRIIAMGFPSEGAEGLYRNPASEVLRFLKKFHDNHYKVFNLCAERDYDPALFEGNVVKCPFDDHQAAPLAVVHDFCLKVDTWLDEDPSNVVVAHCKAGKGRTGLMICAYLLYSGLSPDPQSSIQFYGDKRTKNGKGVTIASQRRYVEYYYESIANGPLPLVELQLAQIRVTAHVAMKDEIHFVMSTNNGTSDYQLAPILTSTDVGSVIHVSRQGQTLSIVVQQTWVRGDIKFQFYHKKINKDTSLFYFWFNAAFVSGSEFVATKDDMDKPAKNLESDMKLELVFSGRRNLSAELDHPEIAPKKAAKVAPARLDSFGGPTARLAALTREFDAASDDVPENASMTLESVESIHGMVSGGESANTDAHYSVLHYGSTFRLTDNSGPIALASRASATTSRDEDVVMPFSPSRESTDGSARTSEAQLVHALSENNKLAEVAEHLRMRVKELEMALAEANAKREAGEQELAAERSRIRTLEGQLAAGVYREGANGTSTQLEMDLKAALASSAQIRKQAAEDKAKILEREQALERRTAAAETALLQKDYELNTLVAAERGRAEEAVASLEEQLRFDATRSKERESDLQSQLLNEQVRAAEEVSALQSKLDAARARCEEMEARMLGSRSTQQELATGNDGAVVRRLNQELQYAKQRAVDQETALRLEVTVLKNELAETQNCLTSKRAVTQVDVWKLNRDHQTHHDLTGALKDSIQRMQTLMKALRKEQELNGRLNAQIQRLLSDISQNHDLPGVASDPASHLT